MKIRLFLAIALLAAALLTACNSAAPTPVVNSQATQPAPLTTVEVAATPASGDGAYPAPAVASAGLPTADPSLTSLSLYPDPASGDQIEWIAAQALILNSEVVRVTVDADQKVTIDLKDGRSLITTQPQPNAVKETISACGSSCQNILVTP